MTRGWRRWVSAALLLAACLTGCVRAAPAPLPVPARGTDIQLEPDTNVVGGRVPRNGTLAGILRSHGVRRRPLAAIVDQARRVFDLRRLQAQHPYRLERSADGLVRRFEYQIDADSFLQVTRRGPGTSTFDAVVLPYSKEHALIAMRGEIDARRSSLVLAIRDSGEQVQLAMAMAEVFSGEIDFNNDLRPGDSFQVLFEKFLRDDRYAGYGAIKAAEFDTEGRRIRAFRYTPSGGKPGYYDEQGRSLKRLFLRSPLRFEPRITSRFSRRRMHPILGEYRAHLGVDYGAPRGAAVVAVAAGTVVSAGRRGGSGRMVRLRHARGYETYYLHLASFASGIHRGAHVVQGQLLGRVGSTGLATGPHLDYRLKKNGVFVNPLVEHRKLPPRDPIPAAQLAAFRAERDRALALVRRPSVPPLAAGDHGAP